MRRVRIALGWTTLALVIGLGSACAEPVNTNQFGFIRDGMSETDLLERLGPPDERRVLSRRAVATSTRHGAVAEVVEKVGLVYRGDGQIMTTYIILENGRVIHKEKRK